MAVGPGAIAEQTVNPEASLWYATDNDVIQVFNPLTEDFIGQVGVDKAVNTPFELRQTQNMPSMVTSETDAQRTYGVNLKNPEHRASAHITTKIKLPAGSTTSLLGGVAKVVVTQLVNEIMQREKNALKLADPHARLEVERRIIRAQGNIQQYLPEFQSERQQLTAALDNLNRGDSDEGRQVAPEGTEATGTEVDRSPQPSGDGQHRGPGRPKKV